MEQAIAQAQKMLQDWKGEAYTFGFDVLNKVGEYAARHGRSALVISTDLGMAWISKPLAAVGESLRSMGVEFERILGAGPNAPRDDLYRLALQVARSRPEMIVALGGGSTIDAAKAANVLATYAPPEVQQILQASEAVASTIEPYFGVGQVSRLKDGTNRSPLPVVAVQTAASSGAHLTKYSNITDFSTGQKKLIVDEALVPRAAVFDYGVTMGSPLDLTLDGGLDGIAHTWEVFMGSTGQPYYEKVHGMSQVCLGLIVEGLGRVKKDPQDPKARLCLGLGTDLGGYAIMIGGTSGPHLGSFSLIDVLSHGRACAILNPYYTVLFASKIQDQLGVFAEILKKAGYIKARTEGKKGRSLAMIVARGMIQLSKGLGFPTTLAEAGVAKGHLKRMVQAAKDPQLKMKLQNMPTPMEAERGDVDRLMKPTLEAAYTGDLGLVPGTA